MPPGALLLRGPPQGCSNHTQDAGGIPTEGRKACSGAGLATARCPAAWHRAEPPIKQPSPPPGAPCCTQPSTHGASLQVGSPRAQQGCVLGLMSPLCPCPDSPKGDPATGTPVRARGGQQGPGRGWATWQEAPVPHATVRRRGSNGCGGTPGSGYSHGARNEERAWRMPGPQRPDCTRLLAAVQPPGLPALHCTSTSGPRLGPQPGAAHPPPLGSSASSVSSRDPSPQTPTSRKALLGIPPRPSTCLIEPCPQECQALGWLFPPPPPPSTGQPLGVHLLPGKQHQPTFPMGLTPPIPPIGPWPLWACCLTVSSRTLLTLHLTSHGPQPCPWLPYPPT